MGVLYTAEEVQRRRRLSLQAMRRSRELVA
jgi:hypothetical protein